MKYLMKHKFCLKKKNNKLIQFIQKSNKINFYNFFVKKNLKKKNY